jgi:hypothetical protein
MNLFETTGFATHQMVPLDLVLDPTLICEVGSIVLVYLHVRCAMKLE